MQITHVTRGIFSFINKKRSVFIGVILFLILISILFINSSENTSFIESYNIRLFHRNNIPKSTRILCLILTTPENFLTRAKAVNQTWAPRCTRYFFITEYNQDELVREVLEFSKEIPIAPIKGIPSGYDHLTKKSALALLFAYKNYFNDFDWFIKVDDDTYLIVDNLKTFLTEQNATEPVTFGYNFKVLVPNGYHSGGASYVLSRESLKRFYEAHEDPTSTCSKDGGNEDVEIAKCLRSQGVYMGRSLDKENRELFHPLSFLDHFRGSFPDWLLQYAENPLQTHYNCCSDQSISFHYVPPDEQYLMDFLLYRVGSKLSTIKSNR